MIRLYCHSSGSFRTVSLGMELACEGQGVLSGTVPGDDTGFDLARPSPGIEADIGVVLGAPSRVITPHLHGLHRERWLLLAPNSRGIPKDLRLFLSDSLYNPKQGEIPAIDGLLAPSNWAVDVLKDQFPTKPVVLWQHGVLPHFRLHPEYRQEMRDTFDPKKVKLLHVTSSKTSRKSTEELVLAWKAMEAPGELDLLVNPRHFMLICDMVRKAEAPGVRVIPGQQFSDDRFAEELSKYHAVVQPSRAEGFGLLPLESRACGVPVVMTECTGHADHSHLPGTVLVENGPDAESDDYWTAKAPTVSVDAIVTSLKELLGRWDQLEVSARSNAGEVRESWSWQHRAEKPISELKERMETSD